MINNATVTNTILTYLIPIIGLAIAAITAVGVFYGPRLVAKRQERKEKLRVHFEDLKNEAQSKISTMISAQYEWQRKIHVFDSSPSPSGTDLSDLSNNFVAHFPEKANDYSQYKQKIMGHNKKYKQFRLTIKEHFGSKGIPTASTSTNPTTCVYDITFIALFRWWEDLDRNASQPQPNFTQIEAKQADGGYYLYASGLGNSPVAYAENDSDKNKLERALLEVAQNKKYKGEAAELLNSYKSLSQELKIYWSHLDEKLKDIEKYWPGLKGHEFRKVKDCSRCKKIFG